MQGLGQKPPRPDTGSTTATATASSGRVTTCSYGCTISPWACAEADSRRSPRPVPPTRVADFLGEIGELTGRGADIHPRIR